MPRLSIDASKWLRGSSVSDTLPNGGFSPLAKGVDLFRSPGVLKPGSQVSGSATTSNMLANGVIAWALPKTISNSDDAYILTANATDDGRVIERYGTTSNIIMATDTARDYKRGISDVVIYKGSTFVSSTTNVALTTGPDYTWWTGTLGLTALGATAPHLFCEYEDDLYFTDGRYIHKWNGATGTYNVLDLPTGCVATSICNYNGYLWIAGEYFSSNPSGYLHGKASLFIWDGFSASWLDEKILNERVDTLFAHRGILYVTTRRTFGYWNGSSVVDLWPLNGQVLKHQITALRDKICFVDGSPFLTVYGSPIPGQQRFFSFPYINLNPTNFDSVMSGWQDELRLSWGPTLATTDFPYAGASSLGACSFYENPYFLGDYVTVTRCIVVLDAAVASGEDITISYVNSNGDTVAVGNILNSDASHTGRREIVFDVENDKPTYFIQPKYTWASGANATGIRAIYFDYESTEDRPTK